MQIAIVIKIQQNVHQDAVIITKDALLINLNAIGYIRIIIKMIIIIIKYNLILLINIRILNAIVIREIVLRAAAPNKEHVLNHLNHAFISIIIMLLIEHIIILVCPPLLNLP